MDSKKRPQNCGTGYCSCIECVMEPAQRTWVGLTEDEIADLNLSAVTIKDAISDALAIEAKLKEKNNG